MKYRQGKKSIQRALNYISELSVSNDTPFDFLRWIKVIHKNLETMKLGVSDINLVDEFEPILHDLRIRLTDLETYYRLPDSEIRKKEILELLDKQLTKFKEIRREKREIDGLGKQDKEISLAEEANNLSREAINKAKRSNIVSIVSCIVAFLSLLSAILIGIFI